MSRIALWIRKCSHKAFIYAEGVARDLSLRVRPVLSVECLANPLERRSGFGMRLKVAPVKKGPQRRAHLE